MRIGRDTITQLEITDPLYIPPWGGPVPFREGTRSGEPTYATAFAEYTGVPAAVGGGGGALGLQVAAQAPQAKWASPWMSRGFTVALAYEAIVGTSIFAALLTIADPSHKYEGGLDEARFHQHEHTNPFSTGNFTNPRSGYS